MQNVRKLKKQKILSRFIGKLLKHKTLLRTYLQILRLDYKDALFLEVIKISVLKVR